MTLGDRIREYRKINKLTQKQLSSQLGLTPKMVSFYECNERIPPIDIIIKLSEIFSVSTDYLLGLEDEIKNTDFMPCPPFAERLTFLLNYFKRSASSVYKNENISKARFYVWKNGVGMPNIDNIVKLAQIFDCSVDFVIGRSKG